MPDSLAAEVDRAVADGAFDSRSDLVRTAVEVLLRSHWRRGADEQYRIAYATHPDTAAELAEATRRASESINEEPWTRWW